MILGPRLISRYLLKTLFKAVLAIFLLCSVLIYLIDFIELLRQAGKQGNVRAQILFLLALMRLPAYTEFLLGFSFLTGTMTALLLLSRRSELAVMRSGGMSVWQLLKPCLILAFLIGILEVVLYNPFSAFAHNRADRLFAEVLGGRNANLLRSKSGESWLRQNGVDGQSVINATNAANRGLLLIDVKAFVFDSKGRFVERIDSKRADLRDGYWNLQDVWVSSPGREPAHYASYLLSTYLTPERVQDALGSVASVSFWELPKLIQIAERAKLTTTRLQIQYQFLLSRPFLCVAMVLLASTVSFRSFRSGGIQAMVLAGVAGGLAFFLFAEVSRQLGVSGSLSPAIAVWLPIASVVMVSLTVLLYQEDG